MLSLGALAALAAPLVPTAAGAGTVNVTVSDDARVYESSPDNKYGTSSMLRTDAGSAGRVESYLRFTVPQSVTGAKVRVYVSGPGDSVSLHQVASNAWDEETITWRNKPARSSAVLGTADGRKGWVEFDVSSVVSAAGTYSFALSQTGSDGVWFHAREHDSSYEAQLVGAAGTATSPSPTTTAPADTTTTTAPSTTTTTAPAPAPAPSDPTGGFNKYAAPYSSTSPWNTPIPANAPTHPDSAANIATLGPTLTGDPTQYTYPVYYVDDSTPLVNVKVNGLYSDVTNDGNSLQRLKGATVQVRIPASAQAAAGTDAQLIILDLRTGDEWGFWQLAKDSSGNWYATNGYHYNIGWSAVPPTGFGSRGAGVPYLTGLIRPWEIQAGRIEHALAYAYDYAATSFVYPATKSDGKYGHPYLPEGARIQLDPSISEAEIKGWGCTGPCLTVAKALQEYGAYVIDNAGRDKVMFEYEGTAKWNGLITANTVSKIPVDRFRRVS